jgi:hypothetical protein
MTTLSETPYLLAQAGMKEEIPAIEEITAFQTSIPERSAFRIKYSAKGSTFTDNNFFKVFNFPFIEGGSSGFRIATKHCAHQKDGSKNILAIDLLSIKTLCLSNSGMAILKNSRLELY